MMAGPIEPDRKSFVYTIDGTTREISSIEPYLYIEHWCNRKKIYGILAPRHGALQKADGRKKLLNCTK
ncbi:unnamed protein product [Cylicocyclus nassatus]|uniref:Uncharacterized protein n=1 Tax=Cylicocyclus nassatus TaxID=53992 RepID=A0AA36DQM7_CYLNA|nr:unnamed protein product [Cylicocyclus nassatus]